MVLYHSFLTHLYINVCMYTQNINTITHKPIHTQKKQAQSKGGILAKTVEYITELKMANSRLSEQAKDYENCNMDIEMLRQQVNCNMNINKAK